MASFEYTAAQKAAFSLLSGPAVNVMLFGGSRSGKTFALCCALAVRALKVPGGRHVVIRRHFNGVKTAIGMDTFPKVMKLRFPDVKFWHVYEPSPCRVIPPHRCGASGEQTYNFHLQGYSSSNL